jgi:hypothetical protein
MAKYNTGQYIIKMYDKYGTPIKQKEEVTETYTQSLAIGRQVVAKDPDVTSFTVDRRLFNSLDIREKY